MVMYTTNQPAGRARVELRTLENTQMRRKAHLSRLEYSNMVKNSNLRRHMKKIIAVVLCIMISTMVLAKDDGYGVSYDGGSVQGIKTGASLKIHVDSNQIRFTQGKQDVLVIPASAVSEITYGQDVHRRVGAAIGLAVV